MYCEQHGREQLFPYLVVFLFMNSPSVFWSVRIFLFLIVYFHLYLVCAKSFCTQRRTFRMAERWNYSAEVSLDILFRSVSRSLCRLTLTLSKFTPFTPIYCSALPLHPIPNVHFFLQDRE